MEIRSQRGPNTGWRSNGVRFDLVERDQLGREGFRKEWVTDGGSRWVFEFGVPVGVEGTRSGSVVDEWSGDGSS